jgi:Putative ATPase subunit of terminase (gpP-like)
LAAAAPGRHHSQAWSLLIRIRETPTLPPVFAAAGGAQRAECAELERETRELVRALYERGAKPGQLAEVLGVSRATIHNWSGADSFDDRLTVVGMLTGRLACAPDAAKTLPKPRK